MELCFLSFLDNNHLNGKAIFPKAFDECGTTLIGGVFTCSECHGGSLPSPPGAFCSFHARSITHLSSWIVNSAIITTSNQKHIKQSDPNHKKKEKEKYSNH